MTEPPIASDSPDLSVLIVNYNTAHLLDRMMGALSASRSSLRIQVIVVDNCSRDNSVELLRSHFPDVELITSPTNIGFGRANNLALSKAQGRFILLLNTDAFVSADTLSKTVQYMQEHPDCGVLGVRLTCENGDLQPSCRYFPTPWNLFLNRTGLEQVFPATRMVDDMSWDHASVRACDWVPGCYYLISRRAIDLVGLFDPRFFMYCEEVDHCRRVKAAGMNVIYYPHSTVIHLGGESAKADGVLDSSRQISTLQIESELLYFRKHYGIGGVLTSVFLTVFADIVTTAKRILRFGDPARARAAWRHALTTIKILTATQCAKQPTR
ncbi:glycosyltransferase family 2 protein [Bradyrhizobium sp. Tv2a-2]|uniref:glycosyltransferase family 2 protein n=1 Tax=Bradyrhizobium sp. Tv2a-2 TaxID=113395 RepID=UPI0004675E0B|nr:glycosyltransferase family 2 protein [Bradyrhizobium sp. Tv2a-2]